MKYSQKYSIVGFLEHQSNGSEFAMSNWPLHITFADVFAIDRRNTDIDEKMRKALLEQEPITINPKQQAKLGNTAVVLVENTDEIRRLHALIINLLEQNGAVFNTPAFIKDGYLPHCTIQESGELHQPVKITEVSLIDMFPDNDWQQRKVIANFELST